MVDELRDIEAELRELHSRGMTSRQVRQKLGMTQPALCRLRRRLGLGPFVKRQTDERWFALILELLGYKPREADDVYRQIYDSEPPSDLIEQLRRVGVKQCGKCKRWEGEHGYAVDCLWCASNKQ